MLTKTAFKIFLDAPMHLWAHVRGLETPTDNDFIEQLKEQGYEVEKTAVEFIRENVSPNFEYQREFIFNNLKCTSDFIVKNPDSDSYDIYEVKSTTDVKEAHEYDILFQYYVASQSINIRRLFIVYINKEYERHGELDLPEAFKIREVTTLINEKLEETITLISKAIDTANEETSHGIPTCEKPKECPCPNLCFPNIPVHSIYTLSNVNQERIIALKEIGVLDIKDIPNSFDLSNRQRLQQISTVTQKSIIDKTSIAKFLSNLEYPLCYLDYEAFAWPIPKYDKHKAYEYVVFQYSLHIQKQTGEIIHKEFLSTTQDDPMKEVVKNIARDLPEQGTIIVWNKAFEQNCNREMGRIYPEYSEIMSKANKRVLDLGEVFSKQMYVDYRFKGSWSLKNILPVMAPELSYKELEIGNGTKAMQEWKRLVYEKVHPKEKETIIDNLLKYCALDTYAMIKIMESLKSLKP